MRILLLGTAALALSGCSFFGGGGQYGAPTASNYSYYPSTVSSHHGQRGAISQWNLEGAIGQEFMVGGDFTTPDEVTPIPGIDLPAVSMKDAYETGTRYEVGLSKTLNPSRKFTVMGSYTTAEGKDVAIIQQTGVPTNQIRGQASDYKTFGIEAGLRQYFRPSPAPLFGSIRPYIEGRVGAAKVDDISLTNAREVGAAPGVFNGGTVQMYEGGWVPTGAGLIGIETPIFRQATLSLETGIRYRGALNSDRTDIGPGGVIPLIDNLNNGSENYSVPVTLRGRYRF